MTAPSATLGDIPRLSWLRLIPFVTRMSFYLNGVLVSMQSLLHGHPGALGLAVPHQPVSTTPTTGPGCGRTRRPPGTGPRTVLDTCNHAL